MRLGIGVAAGPDPEHLAGLARAAEVLEFESVWVNDSPAGEGLAQLSVWAGESKRIRLCVGVIALDRHEPRGILDRIQELDLPVERVLVGLGAGFTSKPLRVVREAVLELRRRQPDLRLAVAAMGPQMCRLAGEIGDAVLLNWVTPERAAWARPLVAEGARAAGREPAEVAVCGYVRTAMGEDARVLLGREANGYQQLPHYARHFEAMGAEPTSVGIAAGSGQAIVEGLKRYASLDLPIVRILSRRELPDILTVARAAVGA